MSRPHRPRGQAELHDLRVDPGGPGSPGPPRPSAPGAKDKVVLQGAAAGTLPEVVPHHGRVADVRRRHAGRPVRRGAVSFVDGPAERLDHLAQEVPAPAVQGIAGAAGGEHGVHLASAARGIGPDDDGAEQPDAVRGGTRGTGIRRASSCGRRGRPAEA